MKKLLSLILIAGLLVVYSILSNPQPASAYCVANETNRPILGKDTRVNVVANTFFLNKYWIKVLPSGKHDCCPSKNRECQNATVYIEWFDKSKMGTDNCQRKIYDNSTFVVNNSKEQLICTVKKSEN